MSPAIPLPFSPVPGADHPNSLAEAVQANLDALATRGGSGGVLYAGESTATYTTTATTFTDIDPGMPRMAIGAGYYLLLYGFQGGNGAIVSPGGCGVTAADAISAVAADTAAGQNSTVSRGAVRTLTSGTLVLLARSTGGSVSILRPWMAALKWQ